MVFFVVSCTINESKKQEARDAHAKCIVEPASQFLLNEKDHFGRKYPNTPEGIRRMCRDAYPIYTRK